MKKERVEKYEKYEKLIEWGIEERKRQTERKDIESGSDMQFDPLSQGLFIIERLDKLPITKTRRGVSQFRGW